MNHKLDDCFFFLSYIPFPLEPVEYNLFRNHPIYHHHRSSWLHQINFDI